MIFNSSISIWMLKRHVAEVDLTQRAWASEKFPACGAELMTVTAKQLRLKTSEVLTSVARGGSVTVTLRGKPVAKLVSLEETRERKLTDFAAFGMWAGRKDMEDPVAWVRRIREPRYRLH